MITMYYKQLLYNSTVLKVCLETEKGKVSDMWNTAFLHFSK